MTTRLFHQILTSISDQTVRFRIAAVRSRVYSELTYERVSRSMALSNVISLLRPRALSFSSALEFLHESIPMDSRSSCNEPAETDATRRILKYEPSSVLFSSAALKTPFALPFLRPSRASHTAAVDASHIFKELQKSVALTAERCAEMLQSLVKMMSSQFHDFCGQVRMHSKHSQNISFHTSNFAAILPGDSVAGVVVTNGILNFLNIYNTILVVRLVLTWFPNAPASIVSPLSTLCDPYLNIFRGLIPPLGGTLDLSPILAFLVLNVFTSTASALPAEIPPSMRSQEGPLVHETHSNYTASQKKWMRRFRGDKSKNPGGVNQ